MPYKTHWTRQRKRKTDRMADTNKDTPAWALELMTQVTSIKETFDSKFDVLKDSIQDVKKDIRAVLHRLNNAESRIESLEVSFETDKSAISELSKNVEHLKTRVIQLESHSRRNNVVFLGLTEGLLEREDQKQVMDQILRYILDAAPGDRAPEVERQHRSFRPCPDPSEPPRPYLIRLLRWEDRQRILRAAAKKQLSWNGKSFYVRQDLPLELQRKRAEYTEIKKKLRASGHRYGILYPAKFIVTIEGKAHIFKDAKEANNQLRTLLPGSFG